MLIGTIGSTRRARVRSGGVIVVNEGTHDEIEIALWFGADDRWYEPEREITARQTLVRSMPIVQTATRVPTGDAVATVFAAVQGPRELVVCDLENRSKLPFVAGIVLSGPGARAIHVDGSTVRVGGFPLVHIGRPPLRAAAADAIDSLRSVVQSGAAPALAREGRVELTGDVACVLVPVTHGTTLRFALLLGALTSVALHGAPVVSGLPTVHEVANGWEAQLGRGPLLRLPAGEAQRTSDQTAIASLLLRAEPAVRAGEALVLQERTDLAFALTVSGFHEEAVALLEGIEALQDRRGRFRSPEQSDEADALTTSHAVRAICAAASCGIESGFAKSVTPIVAGALEAVLRATKRTPTNGVRACLWWASLLFERVDDTRAYEQALQLFAQSRSPWPMPEFTLPPIPSSSAGGIEAAPESFRLHRRVVDAVGAAARVGPPGVSLLNGFDESWRGHNFEVRNVSLPGESLSFAVRWHGERPALLWERFAANPAIPGHATVCNRRPLIAPSVDPAFSSTQPSGEALLTFSS